jgi:peptidoglycan/LPS O-acetylase OafA/YrhL
MSSGTRYHPYIDGLRAVAVLSVVLYHVGLPFVPGGFVGVDIFFVISGFLIINQIRAGIASGRFSFADFWARRVVRILPPYLLVVAASVVAAPFILVFADEYRQFGTEVAYSGAMASNFLYLGQEGYFNPARDTKVLLHLWSLAVEEQFYLLAPIIMVLIWKLPTKLRNILIAALLAMSFVGCIYWTSLGGDRNYSFYLAPMRAWEFIIGGLVASLASYVERLPSGIGRSLPIAGLTLIVFSVVMFTTEIPFPSYNAALPVFGAVLVIAGCISAPDVAAARALSMRPIVFIGLVSYAWYLWHWPLLTLSPNIRVWNTQPDHQPSNGGSFLFVGSSHLHVGREAARSLAA